MNTPLFDATKKAMLLIVEAGLEITASAKAAYHVLFGKTTPMHAAACCNDVDGHRVMQKCIENGILPEKDSLGATPLHLAALSGNWSACKMIIDKWPQELKVVCHKNNQHMVASDFARTGGFSDLSQWLGKMESMEIDDPSKTTALMYKTMGL